MSGEFTIVLARLLSQLTGNNIYPSQQEVPRGVQAEDFTLDCYAKLLFDNGSIGGITNTGSMDVYVQMVDGERVLIHCHPDEPVFTFKKKFEMETGMAPDEQNLMFNMKPLEYGLLKDHGIKHGSVVHFVITLESKIQRDFYLNSLLSVGYNYDFRKVDDHGKPQMRGGVPYYRPCGCMRNALNVSHKFDGGNDTWLGQNNAPGEWCVSYNGSNCEKFPKITEWGNKLNLQKVGGVGVFCTPNFNLALEHSDVLRDPTTGKRYKLIFQNRTNPTKITKASQIGGPEDFWYVTSPSDVRAYSICVFEMK